MDLFRVLVIMRVVVERQMIGARAAKIRIEILLVCRDRVGRHEHVLDQRESPLAALRTLALCTLPYGVNAILVPRRGLVEETLRREISIITKVMNPGSFGRPLREVLGAGPLGSMAGGSAGRSSR